MADSMLRRSLLYTQIIRTESSVMRSKNNQKSVVPKPYS
jgi:hypothetical protein